MKAVIFAGGYGARINDELELKPKPMIEIGGKPVLWHIMKHYSSYGIYEFIICLGYKGYMIKEFFNNYFLHMSDVTFDLTKNQILIHSTTIEPWKVTLVDTGISTMTGGRIKRIEPYIGKEPFMLTYGDGLSNVNLDLLLAFHRQHGKLATLTAVQMPSRFGLLELDKNSKVVSFSEKPSNKSSFVNSGFYVLEPRVFSYLHGEETVFEKDPLEKLSTENELLAFEHGGFWRTMDSLRDKIALETLWNQDNPPWKTW
jgi:glucose-1-phosphate cytidylyltransferase